MHTHRWLTLRIWLLPAALILGTETGAQAQTKTVDGKTYTLSWSDEFNGTSVDSSKWFITSDANYYGASLVMVSTPPRQNLMSRTVCYIYQFV
jgi:hypothetical protein